MDNVGRRKKKNYKHQFCAITGFCAGNLTGTMTDKVNIPREREREREREEVRESMESVPSTFYDEDIFT